MYKVTIDRFSGPLDLLLHLIEKEKLDISRISIAKVTDEFLEYLEIFRKEKISEIANFLYLAAKLIYLKSTILLPYLTPAEEEEILKFEKELRLYKEFQEATKIIKSLLIKKRYSFSREKFFLKDHFFIPPKNINLKKIFKTFKNLIDELSKEYLFVKKLKKKEFSIAQKMKEILDALVIRRKTNFVSFIKKSRLKMEIIISFLAILELVKRGLIKLRQEKVFGEIEIIRL